MRTVAFVSNRVKTRRVEPRVGKAQITRTRLRLELLPLVNGGNGGR